MCLHLHSPLTWLAFCWDPGASSPESRTSGTPESLPVWLAFGEANKNQERNKRREGIRIEYRFRTQIFGGPTSSLKNPNSAGAAVRFQYAESLLRIYAHAPCASHWTQRQRTPRRPPLVVRGCHSEGAPGWGPARARRDLSCRRHPSSDSCE